MTHAGSDDSSSGTGRRAGWHGRDESGSGSGRSSTTRAAGGAGGRTSATGPGPPSARTTATDGDAWGYLPHDLARSKAYRWGEDGIAGVCDRYQLLCFAPAFWNGRDPILKERLFGLTPDEGNHGEDVKEYYFYLDNTPTHSYMKFLYKYPQAEFPYGRLIEENRPAIGRRAGVRAARHRRLRRGPLLRHRHRVRQGDAGGPLHPDRGVQPRPRAGAAAHPAAPLVPQHLGLGHASAGAEPQIALGPGGAGTASACGPTTARSNHPARSPIDYRLGPRFLYATAGGQPLFTDNETNMPRVFGPARPEPQAPTSRTPSTARSSTARPA